MKLKDSGNRTEFNTGAVRDAQGGKGRMDLLPFRALLAVSKIYEAGCQKYGDRNWEKGIPLSRFADSGLRHFSKWMTGWDDEPHLDMAIWNLLCLRDTQDRINEGKLPRELDDLPDNPDSTPDTIPIVERLVDKHKDATRAHLDELYPPIPGEDPNICVPGYLVDSESVEEAIPADYPGTVTPACSSEDTDGP